MRWDLLPRFIDDRMIEDGALRGAGGLQHITKLWLLRDGGSADALGAAE
eukprot:gene21616-52929_t